MTWTINPFVAVGNAALPQRPRNGDAAPDPGPCTAVATADNAPCTPDAPSAWDRATEAQRAAAASRLEAVQRSNALHAEGHPRADADALAAAEAEVSDSAVGAWRGKVKRASRGMGLEALIDRPRTGRPPGKWGTPGVDTLWRLWCSDYLREEAPPASAVHRRLGEVAEQRGWVLPPLDAFLRRTRRDLTRAEIVRAREGALAAMNLVPHQTRTVAGLKPLDIVNGDGRSHDVLVTLPSGKEGRPTVWMWQDVRTRRVLAWRAGETESADLVRTSLHELIVKYGVPGRVLVDSTRAASAKWATGGQPGRKRWRSTDEELPGLLHMLDIGYSATKVDRDAAGRGKGRGRAKPVERAFLDLANHIDTHPLLAGAYTGRSTVDRPETHRMRAAPWDVFLDVVVRCVAEHNAREGRQTEAAAGRSFNQVWAEEFAGTVVRRVAPSQAAILLLAAEDTKIDRSGCLRLKAGKGAGLPANRYHHPDLVERAGERVVARFDPKDLHGTVHVFDAKGRYVCAAGCILPVGFRDTAAPKQWEGARRRDLRASEAGLNARRDMGELLRTMASVPPPEPTPEPAPAAIRLVTGDHLPEAAQAARGAKAADAAEKNAAAPPKRRGNAKVMAGARRLFLEEE